MRKRLLIMLLALALCSSGAFAAEPPEAGGETGPNVREDAEGTLSFGNLERRIRENNASVKALDETISAVAVLDYDKMYDDLRDALNQIASAQWTMTILGAGDSYTHDSLSQSYASLEDSFEDLKDGKLQDDNEGIMRQMENAQNQTVVAAETLYVSLLEMENNRSSLEDALTALDRTVEEMELRYQRGQISALQLEQTRSGRTQLQSSLDTLNTNIGISTAQMENLVGLEPTGTLQLAEVDAVSQAQIDAMSYDADLASAKEKSYTLYDAAESLEDARDNYQDAVQTYGSNEKRYEFVSAQHTWQAAQYTYQAAIRSFELEFRSAYDRVGDYRQVLSAAETALDLAKDTYAAQETKYRQGNLPQNKLLDAQDELHKAEAAVLTARHNLFTAYRTYWWAVEYGVLN